MLSAYCVKAAVGTSHERYCGYCCNTLIWLLQLLTLSMRATRCPKVVATFLFNEDLPKTVCLHLFAGRQRLEGIENPNQIAEQDACRSD
jgi:hypothetical protein